jgi:hypothetical protein
MDKLIRIKCLALKLVKKIIKNLIFKILNLLRKLKKWKVKVKMMVTKVNLININNSKK